MEILNLNKEFYLNRMQLSSYFNQANQETNISGRATGKSTAIGVRFKQISEQMPCSTNIFSAATFAQALTITLLPVFGSLSKLGWKRNVHYVIGKPPSSWKNLPLEAPGDWSKFITFKTGAGFHIASQDREGMNRGRNIDSVIGDEMLTQDRERFEAEILGSNRGNDRYFGKCPLHHSVYLQSSMPTGAESLWLLDHAKYYEADGVDIWTPWNNLCKLQLKLIDSNDNKDKAYIIDEIVKQSKLIRYYPKQFFEDGKLKKKIFTCYNVFDNLKNVGISYVLSLRRQMSDLVFMREVLNMMLPQVEEGFYKLNESHLYTKYDYSYIDSLDYDWEKLSQLDARRDADVIRNKPLHIAIDYGASITAGWAVQPHEEETRWLKSFYVKHPLSIEDWVDTFCQYYSHHQSKCVNHYYDHTAKGRDTKYQIRTAERFRKNGWTYVPKYVGHTPEHEFRFEMWDIVLQAKSITLPKQLFNKDNCKEGLMSMQMAGIRQSEKGYKKDKRSEASVVIPREHATDFSDAADILLFGLFKDKFKNVVSFSAQTK